MNGMDGDQAKLPPQVRAALEEVTQQFRRRLQARGWLRFGVATLLLFALGTLLLTTVVSSESDTAKYTVIAVVLLAEAAAAWRWLFRPLRMPIPAAQVALYIDQKHPELENRIVSAIDLGRRAEEDNAAAASRWMVQRLLEETNLAARSIPLGSTAHLPAVILGRVLAALLLAAALALLLAYSAYWTPDVRLLGFFAREGPARVPFSVKPGDAEVRRGDNLVVLVETESAGSPVAIAWRTPAGEWAAAPMNVSSGANVHHYEFRNIQEDRLYRVQAGPHRSPVFTITAWQPPRVEDIRLRYEYPAYLGRAPEEVPNGGPINAVEGTRVAVEISVNKQLDRAELVLESGTRVALSPRSDAVWTGGLLVARNDKYHIEVVDRQGRSSDYEPVYDITAVPDKPPEVRIAFPRGDDEVTPIEEIPFALDVTDDFGVASVAIQYEVAGREPVRVALAQPQAGAVPASVHGEHLLMLEDLGLAPGDLVTWTVWTEDKKPGRDPYETLGDPYFLEVRPFDRSFEEAVSNAGAGQAGQQGAGETDPLQGQRDILIATWNLRRRAGETTGDEFREKRAAIVQAQNTLLERAREHGGNPLSMPGPMLPAGRDDAADLVERLVQAQQNAVEALERSEWPEPAGPLSEAMVYEQEAYSLLKKLQPARSSVQQAQSSGQGQGQGQSANQREIDELELARNRNFYEEEQHTQPPNQEAADQVRQAMEELTQRQQVANEEMARLISELQQAKTEEEREDLQRRLERLEEELQRNLERLDQLSGQMASNGLDPQQAREAQQQLGEARREMNRSLEEVRRDRLQQARAAGSRAAGALDEARREMEGLSGEAAAAGLRSVRERMANLEERQESVLDRLEQLKQRSESESLDDLGAQQAEQDSLLGEKEKLAEDLKNLMEDAGKIAAGAHGHQALMARKLNDWLRKTSGTGILENMEEAAPLVRHGIWDSAIEQEGQVRDDLKAAGEGLREVEDLLVEDETDSLRLALRELRDVLDQPAPGDSESKGAPQGQALEGESGEPSEAQQGQGATQAQSDRPRESSEGDGTQAGANPQPQGLGGTQPGGDGSYGGYGGYGPEGLQRFISSDYGRWIDAIRNAEDLLPEEPAEPGLEGRPTPRQRLARAREAIGEMRRDYRGSGVAPQFEGFVERVVNPVQEAAAEIDRRLHELLKENEFALDPRASVPAQYRDRVAEYFRALSEAEANRQ